jgi:hypothetical protein
VKRQLLFNLVLGLAWVSAALALTLRVYSLRFNPPPSAFLFWLPYLVLVSTTAIVSLTRHDKIPIFVILGLALTLHSINVLRQPGDINWAKDPLHDLQIATTGLANGHFVLGNPSLRSHAFDQSFYPGLEFLTSSLNLVAEIPLMTLYNYTFVPVNLLTLLFFYLLMRTVVEDPRIVNISVLLYALCPQFNMFDSVTLHESLAIILFPLAMAALLAEDTEPFRRRGMLILMVLSTGLITITNEFTMYVLTFNAFIIVVTYLLTGRGQKKRLARTLAIHKLSLLLLCVTLLLAWLSFIAVYFLQMHTNLIAHIINSLTATATKTGGAPSSPYSLSFLESSLSYVGFGLLMVVSMVGIYSIVRTARSKIISKVTARVLVIWWIASLGMIVLFEIIPWQSLGESPIRFRSMEFAYFGIAPFAAIGIQRLMTFKSKRLMNDIKWKTVTKTVSLIMIALIAIPTILVGFSYYQYDNQPPKDMSYLNSVEAYFSSVWLSQHSESNLVVGTGDGQTYVSAYATNFSYTSFRTSIQKHVVTADTYYVNLANVFIPDGAGFTIGTPNLLWLDSNLSRVYDSGSTIILTKNNQSRTP